MHETLVGFDGGLRKEMEVWCLKDEEVLILVGLKFTVAMAGFVWLTDERVIMVRLKVAMVELSTTTCFCY